MFIFDYTNPERDGSLENDIIVHENTHGITNRMTGGGTARCVISRLRKVAVFTLMYRAVAACRLFRLGAWERDGQMLSRSTSQLHSVMCVD